MTPGLYSELYGEMGLSPEQPIHKPDEPAQTLGQIELLRMDVERLLMINEALWGMLKEGFEYTDEDLIRRIREIDLRDGKYDGKVAAGPPPVCPSCRRTLFNRQVTCLYCGTEIIRPPFDR